jgi:calpain-7
VGRAGVGDEGEEAAVVRRGGRLHGIETESWRIPSDREFVGEPWRGVQPELAEEQIKLRAEWAETPREAWKAQMDKGRRWVVRQGVGADCSVVAGLGVCLEHDRRWGTSVSALSQRRSYQRAHGASSLWEGSIRKLRPVYPDTPRMGNMS